MRISRVMLQDALSTAFVTGVSNESTRIHLMTRELKKMEDSVTAGRRFESAAEEARLTRSDSGKELSDHHVKKVHKKNNRQQRRESCERFSSRYHDPDDCPYKDKICYSCPRTGHIGINVGRKLVQTTQATM